MQSWYKEWYGEELDLTQLPKHGVIVPGFAAYFLYLTGTSIAFPETLIRNPKVRSDEALTLVTQGVAKLSQTLGVKLLIAHTANENVKDRAQDANALCEPGYLLKLKLKPQQ